MLIVLIVLIGWVMFRAQSVGQVFDIYKGMLGLTGIGVTSEVA